MVCARTHTQMCLQCLCAYVEIMYILLEVKGCHLPQLFSIFYVEVVEPGLNGLISLASQIASRTLCLHLLVAGITSGPPCLPSIYVDAGDTNAGPYAHTPRALVTFSHLLEPGLTFCQNSAGFPAAWTTKNQRTRAHLASRTVKVP